MLREAAALTLVLTVACTGSVPTVEDDLPCVDLPGDAARGDRLLAGRYELSNKPAVELGLDLDWDEDPFNELNWQARLANLRWTEDLVAAWQATGDERYLDRYRALLRDWIEDNPVTDPPSVYSWEPHITAQRAFVLACATRFLDEPWLRSAIEMHGRRLAREDVYLGRNNHALNQNIALALVGCALDRPAWMRLATERLDTLARASIDAQGVTNEQSVYYHLYNYQRYGVAEQVLTECDQRVPEVLRRRRPRMVELLTHATLPNGTILRLGDTAAKPAEVYAEGTAAFAASLGREGVKPDSVSAIFDEGFVFGRSGWGEERAFSDETMYSLRFGDAPDTPHGHSEGTALTLYSWGRSLLEDSGVGRYRSDAWRRYFKSPRAHNRVVLDGVPFDNTAPVRLVAHRAEAGSDVYVLRTRAWEGATVTRWVAYSRAGDYLLVADRIEADRPVRARQLWHFPPEERLRIGASSVRTLGERGNVWMTWLSGPELRTVEGSRRPIQGWVSYDYDDWEPAPVVEAIRPRARTASFITLIKPREGGGTTHTRLSLESGSSDGFVVNVEVDQVRERIEATRDFLVVVPA